MAKIVIRLTAAALILAAGFAAAAAPKPTTLAQVFPELTDLSETKQVGIGIGWMGLSPLSPLSAGYILELHGDQFEGQGVFQTGNEPVVKRAVAIPRELVRAFLTAATKVAAVEGEYRARIEHTDDYPSLDVEVSVDRQVLKIGSQSQQRQAKSANYPDRTPWRIVYRDRTFVVTAGDLDRAYATLEPYLQDEKVFAEMWEDYKRKQ
jgi:hypothetical protein